MSVFVIPFNNNPASTEIKSNASYTVPANKYARISVLSTDATDATLDYDLSVGGASSVVLAEDAIVNEVVSTNSSSFVTAYTVPAGFSFYGQIVCSHAVSAGGGEFRIGSSGYAFLSNSVTGTPVTPSAANITPFTLGPGSIIQHRTNAGSTASTNITGLLKRNASALNEFWLRAGDQITYPGVILINEYNVPS